MLEPHREHVSDMFGVELVFLEEDGVCHAQGHGAVVCPDSDSSCSRVQDFLLDSQYHVFKAIYDQAFSFLVEGNELS